MKYLIYKIKILFGFFQLKKIRNFHHIFFVNKLKILYYVLKYIVFSKFH